MIQANTIEELESLLEKALKKARDKFPEYRVLEFGLYEVRGSRGNWYQIRAGRNEFQNFFIACVCRGALESRACYHSGVVFIIHQREAQRLKDEQAKKEMESAPYFSGGNSSTKKPDKIGDYRV